MSGPTERARLYLCHETVGAEVLLGHLLYGSECQELSLAALPLDEIRPTLAAMIRDGTLAMFEERDSVRELTAAEALTVIAEDSNWFPPSEVVTHWVYVTDAGRAVVGPVCEMMHANPQRYSTADDRTR